MAAVAKAKPKHFPNLRVPHVAEWTSEKNVVLRACRSVNGKVATDTDGRQGRGKPNWGVLHPRRQRETMMRFCCQVCNEHLGDPIRLMDEPQGLRGTLPLKAPPASRMIVWDGLQAAEDGSVAILEPWLCVECAGYAMKACPGMQRVENRRLVYVQKFWFLATDVRLDDGRVGISYIKVLASPIDLVPVSLNMVVGA